MLLIYKSMPFIMKLDLSVPIRFLTVYSDFDREVLRVFTIKHKISPLWPLSFVPQ